MTYERSFIRWCKRELPGEFIPSCWFWFKDANGTGYCQTDLIWDLGKSIIVFECKLTYTKSAEIKLAGLYLPIVEAVFQKPARGVQVCKNLGKAWPSPLLTWIEEVPTYPGSGILTLHWRN